MVVEETLHRVGFDRDDAMENRKRSAGPRSPDSSPVVHGRPPHSSCVAQACAASPGESDGFPAGSAVRRPLAAARASMNLQRLVTLLGLGEEDAWPSDPPMEEESLLLELGKPCPDNLTTSTGRRRRHLPPGR